MHSRRNKTMEGLNTHISYISCITLGGFIFSLCASSLNPDVQIRTFSNCGFSLNLFLFAIADFSWRGRRLNKILIYEEYTPFKPRALLQHRSCGFPNIHCIWRRHILLHLLEHPHSPGVTGCTGVKIWGRKSQYCFSAQAWNCWWMHFLSLCIHTGKNGVIVC